MFSFFFFKDKIASFQLKEIVVFFNQVFGVVFVSSRDCDRITTGSRYCSQLILFPLVCTLNMNYDRKKESHFVRSAT